MTWGYLGIGRVTLTRGTWVRLSITIETVRWPMNWHAYTGHVWKPYDNTLSSSTHRFCNCYASPPHNLVSLLPWDTTTRYGGGTRPGARTQTWHGLVRTNHSPSRLQRSRTVGDITQYNNIRQYIQCNAMQCNAMQCNTIQYNTMQCNTMQCNTMQCNAMQCNTIQNFINNNRWTAHNLHHQFAFISLLHAYTHVHIHTLCVQWRMQYTYVLQL